MGNFNRSPYALGHPARRGIPPSVYKGLPPKASTGILISSGGWEKWLRGKGAGSDAVADSGLELVGDPHGRDGRPLAAEAHEGGRATAP